MTFPRIYLPHELEQGKRYDLPSQNRSYIRAVLRLGDGDPVRLFNGKGSEGDAVIRYGKDQEELSLDVRSVWKTAPDPIAITLAQSLPKSGKMEFILQKATELGVLRIIPFISRRSVSRPTRDKAPNKQDRWQKIAMEAARQCRRGHIPEVSPLLSFETMLEQAAASTLKMVFWEDESAVDLKGILNSKAFEAGQTCFIAIGPEGGFDPDEVRMAKEKGFLAASLGRHILRTETAALAVIAIIQYQNGTFFDLPGRNE